MLTYLEVKTLGYVEFELLTFNWPRRRRTRTTCSREQA